MDQQQVTLIVSIVGIAGTLTGSITAQLMARSSQRQQWILDQRKQEAREFLTIVARFLNAAGPYAAALTYQDTSNVVLTELEVNRRNLVLQEFGNAAVAFDAAVHDRIFLYEEMDRLGVRRRARDIKEKYIGESFDYFQLVNALDEIRVHVVENANWTSHGILRRLIQRIRRATA